MHLVDKLSGEHLGIRRATPRRNNFRTFLWRELVFVSSLSSCLLFYFSVYNSRWAVIPKQKKNFLNQFWADAYSHKEFCKSVVQDLGTTTALPTSALKFCCDGTFRMFSEFKVGKDSSLYDKPALNTDTRKWKYTSLYPDCSPYHKEQLPMSYYFFPAQTTVLTIHAILSVSSKVFYKTDAAQKFWRMLALGID